MFLHEAFHRDISNNFLRHFLFSRTDLLLHSSYLLVSRDRKIDLFKKGPIHPKGTIPVQFDEIHLIH